MGDLWDRLRGSDVPEMTGDPIANALKGGRQTEIYVGEIEEYGGHPARVSKQFIREPDKGEYWEIEVALPNGPRDRTVKYSYEREFEAKAVLEKIVRDYDLEEWDSEKHGSRDTSDDSGGG